MIGRMLSVGLDTNPIIVDYSYNMPKYLKEQYLGMFVKYTGNSTDEYKNGYTYQVSQKQSGADTVYFFAPYFYLESLTSSADTSKIIDGYQAYNDNGKKIVGQYKTSEKVITKNGTFYPADDNVNAYSKVTVNVESGSAQNPYVATTDAEMDAYLAAEYKDSFVRMDYAKYRVTLPANATSTTAVLKCRNIGIPRMCAYIDKWLGSDSEKVILNLQWLTFDTPVNAQFKVYKKLNANGTYAYALGMDLGEGISPMFIYNAPDGTVFGSYVFHPDEFTVSSGWLSDADDYTLVEQINEIIVANLTGKTCQYTVAVSDALVLTNMAGSEVDNKYVEGGVYKVTAQYNEINTYVAESPFQVGDQLAGATVYLNQQITSDEFEEMCDELAKRTSFGIFEGMFIFANVDYPLVEPGTDADYLAFYGPQAFLLAGQNSYGMTDFWQLISISINEGDTTILGKRYTSDGPVPVSPATPASFTVLSSITLADLGALTVPATITKINFPTLLNAIAGKTANFSKQTVAEAIYDFELQLPNGAFEEAQTEAKLDAKIVNDNIGKIYQYTGTTGNKYKNQSLYIIMED